MKPANPILIFALALAALLSGNGLVSSMAWAGGEMAPGQDSAAPRGLGATAREELQEALQPKPPPEAVRKQRLDALFERLREAREAEEAEHIALLIEGLWLQSSSDTANLLMQRAVASIGAQQFPLALSLLDKLVLLEPDWAEPWNQRATVRFMIGDLDGAMTDINHVIRLEPRHFGALTGMGLILQREGFGKRALEVFNKALSIYPLAPDIRTLADKLTLDIEGRDI
jgi:tetratricopeptide (TPR) repeat protein